jgi:glycosyltransferase involved in cell wall biosynthesis
VAKAEEKLKIALVHDWMTNWGGGERVLWSLHELFPKADIFTSVYNEEAMPEFKDLHVETSYLQNVPLAKSKHQLFPIFRTYAMESFDFSKYDVVITTGAAESKGIVTKPGTLHISYLFTPTRYYWSEYDKYLADPGFGALNPIVKIIMPVMVKKMRHWDYAAAQRPDVMVGISQYVSDRIKKYYGRKAPVLFPPVDAKRFKLTERKEDFYLVVGRQVPYKRVDLAVQACTEMNKRLIVIGEGSEHENLKKMAGPTIEFKGRLNDKQTAEYYARAKAFLFTAEEDFGITPLEAMACGTPVIAYGKGGATETVKDGITGMFFDRQTPESLMNAIQRFEKTKLDPKKIRSHALTFDDMVFKKNFHALVEREWKKHKIKKETK